MKQRRAKGAGHLIKRGGVWHYRLRFDGRETWRTTHVRVADDPKGVKARKVLDDETAAFRIRDQNARLAFVKTMIEDGEQRMKDALAGVTRNVSLADLADIFRNSPRRVDCSERQLDVYLGYVASLVAATGGDILVSEVDDRLASKFASVLAVGKSPNTYNKHLNGLALVWRAVAPDLGLTANPWERLPRKRLDTHVRRALTEAETTTLLSGTDGEMRVLVAIGLFTGLRLGDAVHLKWEAFGDGGKTLRVKTAKTGAEVELPVHPTLREVLGEPKSHGFVVPTLAALYDERDASAVAHRVKVAFEKCGIKTSVMDANGRARPDATFHALRHTFVSRCAAAGIAPQIVRALVGHTTLKMTEHYTHIASKDFLDAFSRAF
jgi:integrase